MKKAFRVVIIIAGVIVGQVAYAQIQNSETLLTINNTPVSADEFISLYIKNTKATGAKIDKSTLDDYLNLFINFKLKVQAARDAGIDTLSSFRNEYNGYIDQLAQSYFIDQETLDALTREAYQRMKEEVSASHILISIPETVTGADTLKYYQKALEARSKVINGEPFGKVALTTSNDPSVSRNNGYLGWFSAFQMVYPFETAAYSTPVDSVSMPVRTRFGYHIIKVHGRRPAKGQIKIAHIMVRVNPNASPQEMENARQKIVDIHNRLLNGESFAELAKKESQDNGTAPNGGELPWIRSGQIIPELEEVAFALKDTGDISKPFQTSFGWHVVKLLDRKLPGEFEEMLPEIKNLLARDSRTMIIRTTFINKLKKEYGVKEFPAESAKHLTSLIDSTIFKGEWKVPSIKANPTVLVAKELNYPLSDLLQFISLNQQKSRNHSIQSFISFIYTDWVNQTIINLEKSLLPQKYPEFKQLANEYLEGMLLFEISNREVWTKASDSVAISTFYENHRDKYTWGEKIYFTVYQTPDSKIAQAFENALKKNPAINPDVLIKKWNKKTQRVTYNQQVGFPDNPIISGYTQWNSGINISVQNDKHVVVHINKTTTGEPKELNDCRAEVMADYQQYLEESWIQTLKEKYKVNINNDTYNKLLENLNN
jgi:peptidyl-prolyl cis-trans isomerase SurA